MNDWKKILEQLPDEPEERIFQTTEINITKHRKKRIMGVSKPLFFTFISLLAAVILLGTLYIADLISDVNGYDRIYPGVTALEIDLGGMTVEEAVTAIENYSDNYFSGKQITMTCMGKSVVLDAKDVMSGVDAESVANLAYSFGRNKNVFARHELLDSKEKHSLTVHIQNGYDDELIRAAVDSLAAQVNVDYKSYGHIITNEGITITRGNDGITLKREELVTTVESMLENNAFGEVEASAELITAAIPDWSVLRDSFYIPMSNAYLVKSGSKGYQVVEAVTGKDVDMNAINADMLKTDWDERSYGFIYTEPEITAEALKSVLFVNVLASAETSLNTYEENRTENVRLAAEKIDGTIVMPGEEFSFNSAVGERTEARGFKVAKVFAGDEIVDGVGGGICQVSSTMYLAALRAELQVTERSPHTYVVTYIPYGQDATVQWGYIDYKFVNNTGYPIRIAAKLEGSTLSVEYQGTDLNPGRTVTVESVVTDNYPYTTRNVLNESLTYGTFVQVQVGRDGCLCEVYLNIYENGSLQERRLANRSKYTSQTKIVEMNPLIS